MKKYWKQWFSPLLGKPNLPLKWIYVEVPRKPKQNILGPMSQGEMSKVVKIDSNWLTLPKNVESWRQDEARNFLLFGRKIVFIACKWTLLWPKYSIFYKVRCILMTLGIDRWGSLGNFGHFPCDMGPHLTRFLQNNSGMVWPLNMGYIGVFFIGSLPSLTSKSHDLFTNYHQINSFVYSNTRFITTFYYYMGKISENVQNCDK